MEVREERDLIWIADQTDHSHLNLFSASGEEEQRREVYCLIADCGSAFSPSIDSSNYYGVVCGVAFALRSPFRPISQSTAEWGEIQASLKGQIPRGEWA